MKHVPVTTRAVLQRVNRALSAHDRRLCVARGKSTTHVGRFYLLDGDQISDTHVELDGFARDLGVLRVYERVAEVKR